MSEQLEDRVMDLEIRLTYQESILSELNEVVVKQQDQIDLLMAELKRQKEQLDNGAEFVRSSAEETPPPHY